MYEGVPTLSCKKVSGPYDNLEAKPKSIIFSKSDPLLSNSIFYGLRSRCTIC